jgi:hypothetical protein
MFAHRKHMNDIIVILTVYTALNIKTAVLCDVTPCMLLDSCHWSSRKFSFESNSCTGFCVTANIGVSPYFVRHHKTAQTRGRIFNYWLIFAPNSVETTGYRVMR